MARLSTAWGAARRLQWLLALTSLTWLMLLSTVANAQTLVRREAAGTPVVPSATALLNWAEQAYPQYFPSREPNLRYENYTYRYYAGSGNYAGVAGSDVYVWGPVSGNAPQPLKVGTLADFACAVTPAPCGWKSTHRVTVAGLTREFIVYQPYAAQAAAPGSAPAVLMLHGTTGTGDEFYGRSGWREKADTTGLIAVFPTALVHCHYDDENGDARFDPGERKAVTKWAAGRLGDPARAPLCSAADLAQLPADRRAQADHALADDLAFLRQVPDVLRSEYPVDRQRIYVTGFSNGGEMAARLAVEASDLFAAVAVSAGGLTVPAVPLPRALSLVQTIGEIDPGFVQELGYAGRIPMDGTLSANPVFQRGAVVPFTTLLRLDATAMSFSAPLVQGVRTNQYLWSTSTTGQRNSFRVVVLAGAEHQYPNGTNHPFRMADALWEFFKDQRLP